MPEFEGGGTDFMPHLIFVSDRNLVDVWVIKAKDIFFNKKIANEHEEGVHNQHHDWKGEKSSHFVLNS